MEAKVESPPLSFLPLAGPPSLGCLCSPAPHPHSRRAAHRAAVCGPAAARGGGGWPAGFQGTRAL